MVYIGMIIVGIIGFILGEGFSAYFRNDESGREDNSALTWILKIGISFTLMIIVLKSCS
jgi:hypothetical protein